MKYAGEYITHPRTHAHTYKKIYIYIYIYIYTNFVEYNRYFLCTYFLVDPFILPYWFYSIRRNWLIYFPLLFIFQAFSARLWTIIKRGCFIKVMELLYVHHYSVRRRASGSLRCVAFTFKYINQFPPNTIRSIRQYERINKKICRQKMSILFNEICITEEMLPIYIYIYIYITQENVDIKSMALGDCHFVI